MKKFLTGFLRFIAVLLAIAFVITTVASLFLYNIEESIFEPDLYKNALVDENIYDRLPSVIGEQLVTTLGFEVCTQNPIACDLENREPALEQCLDDTLGSQAYQALIWNERTPTKAELQRVEPCFAEFGKPTAQGGESDLAPFVENLTAKDWELLIVSLIPPDELRQMTETGMDEFFAFLNGEQTQASIPMLNIKKRLAGDQGLDAILRFLKAQPPCTAEDLLQLQNVATGGKLTYCNPPEEMLPLVTPVIATELHSIAARIPKEIAIGRRIPPETLSNLQDMRIVMRLSPLIAMGLLLFITILVVRSPKSWLRWWGIPLLTAGTLGLFVGIAAMPLIRFSLDALIYGGSPTLISTSVIELTLDLASGVLRGLTSTIIVYALLIALFGLGMTIASVFVKFPQQIEDTL